MSPDDPRPLSALPSVRARVLAFLAIVVAGISGGLIGGSFVDLQCTGSCSTPVGIGAVVGAVSAAAGVAVVAVLTLRAMGEWKRISMESSGVDDLGAESRGVDDLEAESSGVDDVGAESREVDDVGAESPYGEDDPSTNRRNPSA